jgi:site-specific recombinase XerD
MKKKKNMTRVDLIAEEYDFWGYERVGTYVPNREHKLGPRGVFMHNLHVVLNRRNRQHALKNKPISNSTAAYRKTRLLKMMNELHDEGYMLLAPTSFQPKHARYLVQKMEREGLSASTITNRFSILKTFLGWIGIEDRLGDLKSYLIDPSRAIRQVSAECDKTWSGSGVEITEIVQKMEEGPKYLLEALYLQLMRAFGLRIKEALYLRPVENSVNGQLYLIKGTKGGRKRSIPIETNEQQVLLEKAGRIANDLKNGGHIRPVGKSEKACLSRFYYVCHKFGVSRKNKVVPHGLRHEYANEVYEDHAQSLPPIKGGEYDSDNPRHVKAKEMVSQRLGHSRSRITSAYIG